MGIYHGATGRWWMVVISRFLLAVCIYHWLDLGADRCPARAKTARLSMLVKCCRMI